MDGVPAKPTTSTRTYLGSARNLPSVRQDLHVPARLAGPSAPFSLQCRQLACEYIAGGDSVEQAAPHCQDPSHSPDPSTLRRWAQRRLLSMCCWLKAGASGEYFLQRTHHRCLGSHRPLPYSAHRGKESMNRQDLEDLKRQIPLMGYLQAQDWQPARPLSRGRWMGLCPLHGDHKPSFLVDANQDLFYCYGCGRGGDVIRFAELYHQVKFPQALDLLRQWRGAEPLLQEVARFYDMQLYRHSEAVTYLCQRGIRSPELIDHMRIGYAPGGCLRGRLTQLGHSLPALRQAGLVTGAGYDAYVHRIVFPLEGNLYGRSLSATAPPHRFLPGAKGGLYGWARRPTLSGSDPCRGPVRLRRVVAGRLSQRHLLAGNPSQCAPVPATLRRNPNRLSGL